jgi:hypothetical protein
MKIKTKNLNSFLNKDGKLKAKHSSMYSKVKFLNVPLSLATFSIWFLTFYLPAPMSYTSAADKQPSPEQLDPTSLLMPYTTVLSLNDINTTTIPIKIIEPQYKRQMQPQIIDAPAVNFGAQIDKELSQNSLPTIDGQSSFLRRQLWQADITIPKAPHNTTAKNKLQNIIDQIRSVKFELKSKIPQPFIAVEPVQQTKSNEILSVTETPQQTEQKKLTRQNQIKPDMPYKPITNKTLQIIENISQHPEQLNNFFELAEVLFYSGQFKEAVTCYQQALAQINPDEATSTDNKPWILFQIANCLRNDDPQTAVKIYRQLIAEYPQSLWADFAKAQEQLILLYQQDNPKKMIEENQP